MSDVELSRFFNLCPDTERVVGLSKTILIYTIGRDKSHYAGFIESRAGKTNLNWIGGPGSSVLATGIVQTALVLREIRSNLRRNGKPGSDSIDLSI